MSSTERVTFDAYVVDVLLPDLVGHDRRPSAFLVYLHLWRQAGSSRRGAEASLRAIAEGTGLSKRAVQTGLAALERRRLVAIERRGPTAVPVYTVLRPWRRKS
jgi:DNA-binding transcriptional ArsR family regulator